MSFLILFILVLISAFFSAAETAFFSLRESEIHMMRKHKEKYADLVLRLKSDPQRILITVLIGNNVVNICIASYATLLAINFFASFGWAIATGLASIVILILCEIFPKSAAFTYRKHVSRMTAIPLFVFYMLLYPLTSLFVTLEKNIRRNSHIQSPQLVSEEEIRIMAELGLAHGEIDHREQQMIENIFKFDDIPVGKIMTPKHKIESLSGEVPVEQIAYFVSQSGFSRFPVFDGNESDIIGYVHTNDVMRVLNSDHREEPLEKFVTPLTRVDEEMKIEEVFRLMTKERSHMYLVHKHKEPEEVLGLVTMENVLEEIVGEIEDETDRRWKS